VQSNSHIYTNTTAQYSAVRHKQSNNIGTVNKSMMKFNDREQQLHCVKLVLLLL